MRRIFHKSILLILVVGIIASLVSCNNGNKGKSSSSKGVSMNMNLQISQAASSNNISQSSITSGSANSLNNPATSSKASSTSSGKNSKTQSTTPNSSNNSTPAVIEKDNTDNRNFDFNGTISKEVLNNYLSKGVTFNGFATWAGYGNVAAGTDPDFEDDFRMVKSIGAMFICRAAHVWGFTDEEKHFADAKSVADRVHAYNPKIILEAAVFEAIYKGNVNAIPIPSWVFEAFSLPVIQRNFSYSDMLYSNGQLVNQWGIDGSVPDISRQETQLWFYYRCCRYIDSGYEAIHLGQLSLMSISDPTKLIRATLLQKIRDYAKIHAPRKMVLLSAHSYSQAEATYIKDGKTYLLLDYHTFPIRPEDNFAGNTTQSDGYQPTAIVKGFLDSIYGKSAGGINPSGWYTDYNPFVVEFDNSGYDQVNKDKNLGAFWPWGYDEITWFSKQPANRRTEILTTFYNWINDNYQYGNILFPARVPLAYPFTLTYTSAAYGKETFNNINVFKANTQSANCILSFNLESTMKSLWKNPK
jgi:hypothetical protein